ncbi:MAG TPA: hypothetical protein VKB58_09980 [Terriglobales bacterium]|nr:hypothetical protein [Terriglobales bacterium]
MLFRIALFAICGAAMVAQQPSPPRPPALIPQSSGTTNNLIAVSPVNDRVVWASGRNGTFTLTTDGGQTWKAGVVKGAEALEFRDVQGVSDKIAYLLSVGKDAGDFRIYKTEDGGANWTMQFKNKLAGAFYDCFAFWTPQRGIAVSDSVNGVFPNLRTIDGKAWRSINENMPAALQGEGSFASSGTCAATQGEHNGWIATGNGPTARILTTSNGGDTWVAYNTSLLSTSGAGAFTLAFRDAQNGMVGGGDLNPKNPDHAATAVSRDGGKTWSLTTHPPVTGAIYGLSYATGAASHNLNGQTHTRTVVITANDGGTAWSPDEGTTWYKFPDVSGYWGVAFANPRAGWLVGTKGRILRITFETGN